MGVVDGECNVVFGFCRFYSSPFLLLLRTVKCTVTKFTFYISIVLGACCRNFEVFRNFMCQLDSQLLRKCGVSHGKHTPRAV